MTLTPNYRCPECRSAALASGDDALHCPGCGKSFRRSAGRPVLFRSDNPLFTPADYADARPAPREKAGSWVPDLSVNLAADRVLSRLRRLLDERGTATVLVVGGGGQRSWLDPILGAGNPHRIVYSDVDAGADVDLFCDGHELPFPDASFDAVVTTAVLEHVLYPERVASEIARVVRVGGYLYSELPFMQQVHEGAYDFTRYTYSGHQRLFSQFGKLEAGMVAGPGTALAWSIENLVLAFLSGRRSRLAAKAAVRIAFFWLKHLDRLLKNVPAAMDGASCTYLLGVRREQPVGDREIIENYVGAKHVSHV